MAELAMKDLRVTYGDFYAPSFQIKIKGKNICKDINAAISGVRVSLGCGFEANSCSFTVDNLYDIKNRKFRGELSTYFTLGTVVEVYMGYLETTLVFMGLISSLSFSYGSDGAPSVGVECLDIKSRMMSDKMSEARTEKKYSEVAKSILKKHLDSKAIKNISVEDFEQTAMPIIEKPSISDYEFLCSIAREIGYEFFVQGDTVYFQKSLKDKAALINLEFGMDLMSFRTSRRLPGQVYSVIVRYTGENSSDLIEFEAKADKIGGGKKMTGAEEGKIPKGVTKVIVNPKIKNEKDAKAAAESMLKELCMDYISCSGTCVGFPEFVPGRMITVSKLGLNDKNVNEFYVVRVEHSIDSSGYGVSFEGKMDTTEL